MTWRLGEIIISCKEIEKYLAEVQGKARICRILPRGRFAFRNGDILYDGLDCSPVDMGEEATGCAAPYCQNCLDRKEQ